MVFSDNQYLEYNRVYNKNQNKQIKTEDLNQEREREFFYVTHILTGNTHFNTFRSCTIAEHVIPMKGIRLKKKVTQNLWTVEVH